jgi:hypothetical protein
LAVFGQSLLILPLQPSSNVPQANASASAGSFGAHAAPHLPFVLHTSGFVHVPQLTGLAPHAAAVKPHSRCSTTHCQAGSGGPQRLAMPFVPQLSPSAQSPHFTVSPQPFEM